MESITSKWYLLQHNRKKKLSDAYAVCASVLFNILSNSTCNQEVLPHWTQCQRHQTDDTATIHIIFKLFKTDCMVSCAYSLSETFYDGSTPAYWEQSVLILELKQWDKKSRTPGKTLHLVTTFLRLTVVRPTFFSQIVKSWDLHLHEYWSIKKYVHPDTIGISRLATMQRHQPLGPPPPSLPLNVSHCTGNNYI